MITAAKRENNKKRSYLLVNRLQGKHIPVSPQKSLELFDRLGKELTGVYSKEKILMIGFAETATAIGAALAIQFNALYIQTTREKIAKAQYLYFSETHSHAVEQKIVRDELDKRKDQIDRIIFVEDEVTTGNTILNAIRIIQTNYGDCFQYSVISIVNGMSEQSRKQFKQQGIDIFYLESIENDQYQMLAEKYKGDGIRHKAEQRIKNRTVRKISIGGYINSRRMTSGMEYQNACNQFAEEICQDESFLSKEQILVLGTEEFMYPAMYVAAKLESMGKKVRFHATTRSPIEVSREKEYPFKERFELRSLYEDERRTFVYDLRKYDQAVIITDAPDEKKTGENTLVNALKMCGNDDITIIRWCEQ